MRTKRASPLSHIPDSMLTSAPRSGIERALSKHAGSAGSSGSSTTAFSGKGQTLGGGSSNSSSGPALPAMPDVSDISPQVKVLAGLVGAYFFFLWISG